MEQEKERLRLEYAHLALQFTKDVSEASKNLAIEAFGFTLEEVLKHFWKRLTFQVQDHKKSVDNSRANLSSDADKKVDVIKGVKAEMDKIGVKENIYSQVENYIWVVLRTSLHFLTLMQLVLLLLQP